MDKDIKKIYEKVVSKIENKLNTDNEEFLELKEQLNITKNVSVNNLLLQIIERIYELQEGSIEIIQQTFFEEGYKAGMKKNTKLN